VVVRGGEPSQGAIAIPWRSAVAMTAAEKTPAAQPDSRIVRRVRDRVAAGARGRVDVLLRSPANCPFHHHVADQCIVGSIIRSCFY
jgi:hypothetical protein